MASGDVPGTFRPAGGALLADPGHALFFCDSGHREALNTVRVALDSGEGFIRISGEVGTGKTMLCRTLLRGLRADEQAVYIPNPHLMPTMLRVAVARELGVSADSRLDQDLLLARTQERLIELAGEGKRVIVCLDEAQAMPDETLEALRLLTNLETERSKLLQVVLFGQPELEAKLAKPELRQVRQRIAWSYRLGPLNRDEVADYVAHRLRTAGCRGGAEQTMFNGAALDALDTASGGIPRLINVIGHKALMVAYGRGAQQVSASDVRAAADDTDGAEPAAEPARGRWLYAVATGALVLGLAALWSGWQ